MNNNGNDDGDGGRGTKNPITNDNRVPGTYGTLKMQENPKTFKHFYYFLWPIAEVRNFRATDAYFADSTALPVSLSLSRSLFLSSSHAHANAHRCCYIFHKRSLFLWHFYFVCLLLLLLLFFFLSTIHSKWIPRLRPYLFTRYPIYISSMFN